MNPGWYEVGDQTILLTRYPESFFGEPMLLMSAGDRVVRLHPVSDTQLEGEDGTRLDLSTMRRSGRYIEQDLSDLTGTLIKPAGPGPHPVAIQVHGSAIHQRDFNRLFAQPFLDAGIAVFIYDKASDATIFSQADVVGAAMDGLAAVPGVDKSRIGLAGFSNGMWSVPMVAARRGDVAFVVGFGAPGVSQGDAEIHRRVKVLRDVGVSGPTLAIVAQAWQRIFAAVGTGSASEADRGEISRLLERLRQAPDLDRYETPEYVRNNPMLHPVPLMITEQLLSGPPDPEVGYDPAPDYERVRCPVFLQYGQCDTSVPVEASVARLTAALERAGVPHAIHVYPGLEHMLNVIPVGLPQQVLETSIAGFHQFRFGEGVREDLTDWLKRLV